ncbi:putative transmembrane protein [Apostichopus japonicus]|uniref:Putative transmembrane protein n=1 Tax=Stichopus japonicus TaxID=307972 RepID=A0A2G8L539_STIJA|nr:putative transmembrane protein [Apostichopus japonicus]
MAKVLVPTEPYTIDIDTYYTELSLMYPQESYISVANSTTKSFTKVSGQEHFGKSDSWVCFVKNISSEHPDCLKGLSTEDFAARSHEESNARIKRAQVARSVTDKPAVVDQVTTTQLSGPYLLTLELNILNGSMKSFKVKVDLKGPHGYLSTYQYPLLKFYAVMSGIYILFCFTWVLLLCRHRQNHFAIHAWIGTILFVGLIEKISFFVKFQHMNAVGQNSPLVELFPEVVSYIRSSLARCLFLIVSIGYCITRATLGTYLYRVILTGGAYFVLKTNLAVMEFSDR